MPFVKGQSGNPGGRPKSVAELREAAQKAGGKAVTVLTSIMNDKKADPRARIAAARELLDRGFGKSPQPIDGDGSGGPIAMEITWQPPLG